MAHSVDSNKKGLETVSIRSVVVLFNSAQTTEPQRSEVKKLPRTYYDDFLSNLAKERKPSPSMSFFVNPI